MVRVKRAIMTLVLYTDNGRKNMGIVALVLVGTFIGAALLATRSHRAAVEEDEGNRDQSDSDE
jgi:hypothetical protein